MMSREEFEWKEMVILDPLLTKGKEGERDSGMEVESGRIGSDLSQGDNTPKPRVRVCPAAGRPLIRMMLR